MAKKIWHKIISNIVIFKRWDNKTLWNWVWERYSWGNGRKILRSNFIETLEENYNHKQSQKE